MINIKKYRDSIVGLGLMILSAFYYKGSFIQTSQLMIAEYGPGFLPKIYSLVLAVLSIVLIAGNLRKAKKEETKAESGEKVSNLRTVATMVLVLLYIMSMKTVGFLLSSAVYMILQLCLVVYPGTEKKEYIKYVIFGIAAVFILHYLFTNLFSLALPTGSLNI